MLCLLGGIATTGCSRGQASVRDHGGHQVRQGARTATPTAAFDRAGRLWVVRVDGKHIAVGVSRDRGTSFDAPARVTRAEEDVDANGEARPKIAFGAEGEIYVSWTRQGDKPYTGDIRFAVSRDGGRTFSEPRTINDDGLAIGHRFDALHVNDAGHVYVAWIDKRDLEAATRVGAEYAGAALYYAVSLDGGRTFAPNRKIKDHICECCRLAVGFDAAGLPVVVWRDVIDGSVRDHGIARFDAPDRPAPPARATNDGWKIDACPHHGPSLSIAPDGTLHLVWFTGEGPAGPGSFYAHSTDGGRTFSAPVRMSADDTVGHAVTLAVGPRVLVAWKGAGREGSRPILLRESGDGGRTWKAERVIAATAAQSDHPFLLEHGGHVYLSWYTEAEGYRLIPVDSPGVAATH